MLEEKWKNLFTLISVCIENVSSDSPRASAIFVRRGGRMLVHCVFLGGERELDRGVGLHHHSTSGSLNGCGDTIFSRFECSYAREGHIAAEFDNSLGVFPWTRETVKDCMDIFCKFLVNIEGIVEGFVARLIAGMNHNIFSPVLEQARNAGAGNRADVVIAFLGPALWSWVEVIETSFANGDALWVARELAQWFEEVIWGFMDITWMDTNGTEYFRKFFADSYVNRAVFQRGRESNHLVNPCDFCVEDDLL